MTRSAHVTLAATTAASVIEPGAAAVDTQCAFPRQSMQALGKAGILGLISAPEVGGLGGSLRDASEVVEVVGGACASTGMVLTMHYCATAIIEKYGPREIREAIARGEHISTLALSEVGSRSHFWAALSTAAPDGDDHVRIVGNKSWATSAGEADSYVWSTRPMNGDGMSTLWLVPASTPGLTVVKSFDGMGLRGNASSPIQAGDVMVPASAMLGSDGGGLEIMLTDVLLYFQVLSASCYLGISEAATTKTTAHVTRTSFTHLGQSLADLPTIRAYLARMRIQTDLLRGLLRDTLTAVEQGGDQAQLRVLEIKAASAEVATDVTDLAMRVCGGAAYRKEVGVERHFRDARAATVMSPTTDLLYDFIGKMLTGLPLL